MILSLLTEKTISQTSQIKGIKVEKVKLQDIGSIETESFLQVIVWFSKQRYRSEKACCPKEDDSSSSDGTIDNEVVGTLKLRNTLKNLRSFTERSKAR